MNTLSQKFWIICTAGLLHACTGEYFLKQNSCPEGEVRKGPICVTASAVEVTKNSASCVDPDLSDLREGKIVTLCDGSVGVGRLKLSSELPSCSKDGEQECINRQTFKALDSSKLDSSKIAINSSIAGVTGTKREMKQCRNASNLNYFDTSPAGSTIRLPNFIGGFAGGNAVGLGWTHGLSLNDPIQLYCIAGSGTGLPGGQVFTGTTYYAIAATTTNISFQATPSGGALTVTGIGGCTGTWVIAPVADGIANYEDTIDDMDGFASSISAPSSSPWGAQHVCNESNFLNVTGTAPLSPSNTTPTNANQSWSQIWQDQLTGLYITNILYNGVPNNRDWYHLSAMCKSLDSLNGGSGGTGWRLPTQKELLQLHINGVSKVSLAGGTTNNFFWSTTGVSYYTDSTWNVYLSSGQTYYYYRTNTDRSALCVR